MMPRSTIVFVVDDDPAVRGSLRNLLRSAGITVEVFPSAQEFLSYTGPHAPECVVLDVFMPGTTGLDLERKLVDSGRALPVVFISGSCEAAKVVAAAKTSAEFLPKPFADDALLDAIQRLVQPCGVGAS